MRSIPESIVACFLVVDLRQALERAMSKPLSSQQQSEGSWLILQMKTSAQASLFVSRAWAEPELTSISRGELRAIATQKPYVESPMPSKPVTATGNVISDARN